MTQPGSLRLPDRCNAHERARPGVSWIRFSVHCLSSAVAATTPGLLREQHLPLDSQRLLLGVGFTVLLAVWVEEG